MALHKKRRSLSCLALTIFLSLVCSGCGDPVSPTQLQAIKNGYRIGYVQEDYYRMTLFAYRTRKPLPPVTSLHMPPVTTVEMFRHQIECMINASCLPYLSDPREMILLK